MLSCKLSSVHVFWWIGFLVSGTIGEGAQAALSQSVQQFGQQIGLALLDSLLQKGQEEVARSALQRQIELLEDINPPYARLLKQIPPEMVIKAALAQRQQAAGPTPDTGDPFLNVLAKNGILVNGPGAPINNGTFTNQQQLGNVFQAVLKNILQAVQPSAVQNSLLGPQLPSQEVTNPLEPNANQLLIPQPSNGGLASLPLAVGSSALFGGSSAQGQSRIAASSSQGRFGAVSPVTLKTETAEVPPNPFALSVPKISPDEPLPSPLDFTTEPQPRSSSKTSHKKIVASKRHRVITAAPPETTENFNDFDSFESTTAPIFDKLSDRQRLHQINAKAVKLLAFRKQRIQLPERKPFEASQQERRWFPTSTISSDYFTSREPPRQPQLVPVPVVLQHPAVPLVSPAFNLQARRTNSHTELQGGSRLSTLNEDGSAWHPPQRVRGVVPSSALSRKKQNEVAVNGAINLPNNWLSGQPFSLDGSISGQNNNDVFSGIDF